MIYVEIEREGPRIIGRLGDTHNYRAWCIDCQAEMITDIRVDAEDWVDAHDCSQEG